MATLIINIEDSSKLKFIKEFLKQFGVEFTTTTQEQELKLTPKLKKALQEYKNGEYETYTLEQVLNP